MEHRNGQFQKQHTDGWLSPEPVHVVHALPGCGLDGYLKLSRMVTGNTRGREVLMMATIKRSIIKQTIVSFLTSLVFHCSIDEFLILFQDLVGLAKTEKRFCKLQKKILRGRGGDYNWKQMISALISCDKCSDWVRSQTLSAQTFHTALEHSQTSAVSVRQI